MNSLSRLAICSLAALAAAPAGAWGPIGHRVSAELAERNISGKTRAEVELILGHEGLAEAGTVPDEQRPNPDPFWQDEASPWHYVTLPRGKAAAQLEHPQEGDAVTALEGFAATLRDPRADRLSKKRALRFIVHLVSDLHQPLHAGNGTDRGGNDFIVAWQDDPRPTNLHWVWDEGMILRQQLSYSEYAGRLEQRLTPKRILANWDADPLVWIDESAELRDRIYPPTGAELGMGTAQSPAVAGRDYQWRWMPVVEERLLLSGVRLAAYLDQVFSAE